MCINMEQVSMCVCAHVWEIGVTKMTEQTAGLHARRMSGACCYDTVAPIAPWIPGDQSGCKLETVWNGLIHAWATHTHTHTHIYRLCMKESWMMPSANWMCNSECANECVNVIWEYHFIHTYQCFNTNEATNAELDCNIYYTTKVVLTAAANKVFYCERYMKRQMDFFFCLKMQER